MENLILSVSDFIAITNQTLEYAYPIVEIEGEVASFKVNQGKFVFFDLKDDESTIGCFMMVFQLRIPIEDGMKVRIKASPKLTKWGKFSLTVQQVQPSGEGALKKSFELLRAKLAAEGLFSDERKRPLPFMPRHIAVISSVDAAGYKDFIKILGDRWGGMTVDVAHVQVQGESAPDSMIRALTYLNEQEILPEAIVMIRGGGSADDLSAFNDELLVRAVATSRVPVLTGIGHEVDESLVDLAADVRAATPSNAAQLLVPDKLEVRARVQQSLRYAVTQAETAVETTQRNIQARLEQTLVCIENNTELLETTLERQRNLLSAFHPRNVLERGYAIVRGQLTKGSTIDIEMATQTIIAEVQDVRRK